MICYVSFATGWTREYVLHSLTFAELIRYLEYAHEWINQTAATNALYVGRIFGAIKSPAPQEPAPAHEPDIADDGGIGELLRRNMFK